MYELYDPCTIMFFFRNKHIMIDLVRFLFIWQALQFSFYAQIQSFFESIVNMFMIFTYINPHLWV